ncbi:MAG: peptidase [candidate division KSB1 bacterium]|nr:peptidase [candidate division KSB1 bacterium]
MRTAPCLVFLLLILGCGVRESGLREETQHLRTQLAKFAPAEIGVDLSYLRPAQRQLLEKLVQAARSMDEIFLRQVYASNPEIRARLQRSSSPLDSLRLQYFQIMFGPFDRLDEDRPFIGDRPKPLGANFYPEEMTKEEFLRWIEQHPEDREAMESNYTVVRRQNGNLVAVPYSTEYRQFLEPAAQLLEEAAELAENASLKRYLRLRAAAFRTNDYFESDLAWMDLDDPDIEFVIGPYEVYEDRLFGYKAAFEAFVTVIDREESAKLSTVNRYLEEMERNLPLPESHKNFRRGKSSPIRVVNEIFSAGDTKAGVQTTAFNLPNDERVREIKGSKKVLLKNVAEAKFKHCWRPIAARLVAEDQLPLTRFDAYFHQVLMHEVSHGLGPGIVQLPDGRTTTVSKELKETYPTIEEAKADVLAIYNTIFLADRGLFSPAFLDTTFVTYLGGMFRSIRFGVQEAHGMANLIQFNYLLEKGAFVHDPSTGRFRVELSKMRPSIRDLAHELLMIEATLDYPRAVEFIARYGQMPALLAGALERVADLPVDIRPIYRLDF